MWEDEQRIANASASAESSAAERSDCSTVTVDRALAAGGSQAGRRRMTLALVAVPEIGVFWEDAEDETTS